MSTKGRVGRIAGLGIATWMLVATGCTPTAATTKPAAEPTASELDSGLPRSSVVTDLDDPNAVAVASSIKKVTVYSDRALVSREAAVKLGGGTTVFAFKQLPGWVDDGSVRAATTAGRIVDVRVGRSYLARATEKSFRKAEEDARVLNERLAALDDELKVLDAEAKQVEDIKSFSLAKLDKDVAGGSAVPGAVNVPGSVGVPTYAAVVDFIAAKMREIAKGRRAVQAERAKLAPETEAINKRLEDLRGLTQLEETRVFVTVQSGAAESAQVQLSYMLPGATWEATHELRAADGDASTAELTSYAVVTQVSGEDWDQAELTFSTQSSTASVRIPELEALTLGDTRTTTRSVETQSASFKRAEAAFQGQNRLWNKRAQSSTSFEQTYQTNFEVLQVTQGKTVQIFQSLQQRGTTAQFKAMSPSAIRADGRSVRVPIGRASLKTKKAIVAAPEQSLNAAQTLETVNEGGQSLLPGSVALYQAGAFLGMTNLDFVADGEPFALFLSGADQLKLSRVLDKKRSALVRKQRTQMQVAFVVTVENLSTKPMSMKLADRIPVSEDKDIIISGVKVSPDVKPDSKGILKWPLTLQAKEKRTFEIQYQIEYPPTLVVEMRRNEAAAPKAPAGSPASPAPAPPGRDLRKDIEQLENAL